MSGPGSESSPRPDLAGSDTSRSRLWLGAVLVVLIQLALGFYFVHLNRLFYERFGPFFDSAAYLNHLVDLRVAAIEGGLTGAFAAAIHGSTVALPWILFAPFASWVPLDRSIGVWLQVAVAVAACIALLRFFVLETGASLIRGVIFSIAFPCTAAAFFFNGGMADFRMDFQLFLLFAAVLALYLRARTSLDWSRWLALGIGAGALCLGRATAVVYLALLAAGLVTADFVRERAARSGVLSRWAGAALIAAIVGGWFYAVNWRFLSHYYLEWNSDVRAQLPLAESWRHLRLAAGHLGWRLAAAGALTFSLAIRAARREREAFWWRDLDLRKLWFSVVPIGYLVFSGSGLNPFISIVGVAGVLLFLLDPFGGLRPRLSRSEAAAGAVAVALAIGGNIVEGVANHTRSDRVSSWVPDRSSLTSLALAIESELSTKPGSVRYYTVPFVGAMNAAVLENTLVFDSGWRPGRGGGLEHGGAELRQFDLDLNALLPAGFAGDEAALRGAATEAESTLGRAVDLVLLPSADSELPERVVENRVVRELASRIESSEGWAPLTSWVDVSASEHVRLWRNERRRP